MRIKSILVCNGYYFILVFMVKFENFGPQLLQSGGLYGDVLDIINQYSLVKQETNRKDRVLKLLELVIQRFIPSIDRYKSKRAGSLTQDTS